MELEAAVDSLSALAQPSRLKAFRLLVQAGPEGLAAGDLAAKIGAPANTMSSHLAILTSSGLIQPRREGRTIFYALQPGGMRALLNYLVADCCGGRPELCALAEDACCETV